MTKTLRITSIIAAAVAVAIFVFPAVFGGRIDPEVRKFLDTPGIVEKFKEARGAQNTEAQNQVPPLVTQAQAFALYLNPPPPPEPTPTPAAVIQAEAPRPKVVTPKFKLIGTSFYAQHPEMSLALIDEPGKGLRWVRQASQIEHLVIDKVENGKIIIRDGQRTEELVAERPPVKSLVKSKTPLAGEQPPAPVETAPVPETSETAEPSAEEQAEMQKLLDEITAMEKQMADSNEGDKEAAAATKELISKLQSMSVSKEEANNLENLGQQLKEVHKEPNQPPTRPPATRRPMQIPPRDRRIPTR
jgi:hypothetical protein